MLVLIIVALAAIFFQSTDTFLQLLLISMSFVRPIFEMELYDVLVSSKQSDLILNSSSLLLSQPKKVQYSKVYGKNVAALSIEYRDDYDLATIPVGTVHGRDL